MAEIRINATGELKLYDSDDSNYVSFKSAGTVSSDITWTLPSADGSSGQVLSTDGSGTLSWATASAADPASADGDSLGTASAEWSDLFLADGGTIQFGNDQDVTLTHVADTGILLNSTMAIQFNDASQYINAPSNAILDINATDEIELNATAVDLNGTLDVSGNSQFSGTVTVGVDDTGKDVKFFGASAGAYMEWDESADELRIMGASADATTSTGKLLLATSLTDINANDVLGKIDFQAPHESGGTDAITVAASIRAVAQSTFSASSNATDLIFYTGHSEAAAEKIRITSQNEIGIAGANYGSDGQVLTSGGAGAAVAWEDAAGTTINNNADNRVITGSGTAGTLNGEADLTFDGTTLVTPGQVSFPASQSASADANTLDDYEEGTWTPSGNNVTFASSDGKYTKIGDTVFAWGEAVWPTTSDTNGARMNGLPFTVNAAVPGFGGGFWGMGENDAHTGATEGQTYISFRNPQSSDSGAGGNEKPNNVFSTDTMKVGVCYKV
jgi:hypothetical protein